MKTKKTSCVACRYTKKKCPPDCPLAPFFPEKNTQQFFQLHKLFGVTKVVQLLKDLNDPLDKIELMKSLIAEANAREKDPVGGCYGKIFHLFKEIMYFQDQLKLVRSKIRAFKEMKETDPSTIWKKEITLLPYGSVDSSTRVQAEEDYEIGGLKTTFLGRDVSGSLVNKFHMFLEKLDEEFNHRMEAVLEHYQDPSMLWDHVRRDVLFNDDSGFFLNSERDTENTILDSCGGGQDGEDYLDLEGWLESEGCLERNNDTNFRELVDMLFRCKDEQPTYPRERGYLYEENKKMCMVDYVLLCEDSEIVERKQTSLDSVIAEQGEESEAKVVET